MATVVQLKRSAVPGKVPDAANLAVGELAINFADGLVYSKNTTNEVVVVASVTTSNIFEGTNLFFTNARAIGAFTAGDGIQIDANGLLTVTVSGAGGTVDSVNGLTGTVVLTTANIAEESNLYYTDARVYSNVVAGGFATETYVDTQITNLVDSSPEALDTLSELAAALGNDNNFATTTVTLIGSAYNQANAAYDQANTATTDAETATTYATAAFDQANVATADASSAFDQANTATSYSTSAYDQANVATTNADGAFVQANVAVTNADGAFIQANVAVTNADGAFEQANTAVTYSTSAFDQANVATTNADGAFVQANIATTKAEAAFDTANLKANITDLTTANVTELTNLYYTNARVLSYLATADVEVVGLTVAGDLVVSGNTTTINATDLAITDAMVYLNQGTAAPITNIEGDGANVSFTANNNFSAGWDVSVYGVDPASYNGLYTNILFANTTHFIVANTNTDTYVSGGTARGKSNAHPDIGFSAGYNDGSYHHTGLFRDASDGRWKFYQNYEPEPDESIFINTSDPSFELANVQIHTVFGNISSLGNHTTSNLIEGTNLYFTNARAVGAFTAGDQIIIDANGLITANVVGGGGGGASVTVSNTPPGSASEGDLYWDEELGKLFIYYTDGDSSQWVDVGIPSITSLTTANVIEQGNLYYTDARVYANISPLLNTSNVEEVVNLYYTDARVYANISALDTDSITEGATNLYFTDERAYANISPLLTTSTVTEGTNLYYTNARVQSYLEASGNIIPLSDNTYNLGSPTNKYKELYLSGNSIYLDNIVIKSSGNEIQFFRSDGETRASIANTPSNADASSIAAALAIALGG